jgi:RND family efflux transporter MFP subunit
MPETRTVLKETETESELRAEIEQLRRRLETQERQLSEPSHAAAAHVHAAPRPASRTLWLIAVSALVVMAAAFFAGYLPWSKRQSMLVAEAKNEAVEAPLVNFETVGRSSGKSELTLPGNIQAVTEAPVLARASGYIRKRYVDIGDHVKAGQLLAEVDAPEVDQQVIQAKASVEQASSALEQANANLTQGRTNEKLYKTTADRWQSLVAKGAVSKQENDTYQAQYDAQHSSVEALEKAILVAKGNIAAAQANLGRLNELQGYQRVRAPFDGVITVRNVDAGALVNGGSTLLFRIGQTGRLRIYVNIPQADAPSVHPGMTAKLNIPDLPSREFIGTVTRTANSLDPGSRTLLTEVQVANATGLLMPGMYAQVDFITPRKEPPLLIPGDALMIRSDGPQVAMIGEGDRVHIAHVSLGRDYGDKVEILAGLNAGDRVAINPGDAIREGVQVKPVALKRGGASKI